MKRPEAQRCGEEKLSLLAALLPASSGQRRVPLQTLQLG